MKIVWSENPTAPKSRPKFTSNIEIWNRLVDEQIDILRSKTTSDMVAEANARLLEHSKGNTMAIRTKEPVNDRWKALSISINEALEDTTEMLPLVEMLANIKCFLGALTPPGWRSRPFYKGAVFEINSTRLGSKGQLLFRMTPTSLDEKQVADDLKYAEADIGQMKHIFGEEEFATFCKNTLGCTIEEAIEASGMTVIPEDVLPRDAQGLVVVPVKFEDMAEFGQW